MGWRRTGLVVAMAMISSVAAVAGPIEIKNSVEAGWTSNATDSAEGPADTYLVRTHELSLSGGSDTVALRGSLSMTQTSFAQTTFEDDAEVAGGLELGVSLTPALSLRLGYAVTRSWIGDDISLPGLLLPVRHDKTLQEGVVEVVVRGDDQQATLGVDWQWLANAESQLPGLWIPPVQLNPDVGLTEWRARWEKALSPSLAVLASMQATMTVVPMEHLVMFPRFPADAGQVAGGLRWKGHGVAVEGQIGADLVWPKGFQELTETMLSYALKVTAQPVPALALSLVAASDLELKDPLDGIAGRTESVDVEGTLALGADTLLFAKASVWREVGVYIVELERSRHILSAGVRQTLPGQAVASLGVSFAHHEAPAENYDKATVTVGVAASF